MDDAAETLQEAPECEPYVLEANATQIPRSSLKLSGTSWVKAPRTPVFQSGDPPHGQILGRLLPAMPPLNQPF